MRYSLKAARFSVRHLESITLRNTLPINNAMRKIISRVNRPGATRPVVRFRKNPIGGKIPVLRIAACDILLHPKECSLGLVFSVTHVPKFLQIGFDVLFCVCAAISRRCSLFSASLKLDFGFITVTDVCFFQLDEFLGKIVKSLEVVAGICDRMWFES